MVKKLVANLLFKLLALLNKREIIAHQIQRTRDVENWLHNHLPNTFSNLENPLIIKDGIYNYFILKNGKLPRIDFTLPNLPLFVVLGDFKNSCWESAELYGMKRSTWQHEKDLLMDFLDKLNTVAEHPELRATVLFIPWEESTDPFTLTKLLLASKSQHLQLDQRIDE